MSEFRVAKAKWAKTKVAKTKFSPNFMRMLAVQNLSLLLGIWLNCLKLRRRSNTNVSTKPENPFTSDSFYGNHAFCGIRLFAEVLHISFEIFRILFGSFQNGFKFACLAINAKVSNYHFFFLPTASSPTS